MPITDEISKQSIKINVVVQFSTGEYFARYQPDAGLVIASDKLLIDKATFAKAILDLRNIKTSIPTDSFTLLDKDYSVTNFLFAPDNKYLNTEVLIYVGTVGGNLNWSEYVLMSRSIIKDISRDMNSYSISLRRNVSLTSGPLWYVQDSLAKDMTEFDTIVPLSSSIYFPATGMVKVGDEIITYTNNDTATGVLSGLARGLYGSDNDSTRITVRADVLNDLDGKYFLINTPTQSYAIWYRTVAGTAPGAYPFNIQVDILTGASANDVATATMNAINASAVFTATSNGEQVIITSVPAGVTSPAQDYDTGFQFENINLSIQDHRKGEDVYSIQYLQANPINAMLQLMISNGGGGPYDVLSYGLGIDPLKIDIAGIETIRDTYYPLDVYRLFIYNISSGHEFFEQVICLPTNTRLISENGLITLVYIDQSTIYDHIIDESKIIGIPDWTVSVDKVINSITINFDYNAGLDSYERALLYEDAASITAYEKKEAIYSFKGIYSDLNGQAIVDDLGAKLLIRLKDPRIRITANTFFSSMNFKLGDTVKLRHRYIPGDKAMGADTDMSILEKGIDFNKGTVSLGLYYTTISISGVKRFGIIGPNQPITAITSQRTFTVANGTWYGVGYRIRIDGEVQTIRILTGNIITVDVAFLTPLVIGKLVHLTEYNSAVQATKDRYIFVSPNTGNFNDGGLPYQIVP